ncbi:TolB family protein [Pseudobowmanella zhangzhouensis]|uniref:TolB family protein n=1 Tax=Pseudobowmanella zhangzhouensis TaxID=1537679 RepID=UPI003623C667
MLFNLRHQCLCALATLLLVACGGESLVDNRQNPDPVVVDVPLAFIKRHVLLDEDQQALQLDLFRPEQFIPGAALYIKARASTSATEINITDRAFAVEGQAEAPLYDVKDLSVSYDGNRLLFAMRAPELEDVDDDEQPSWNLWEYTRDTDQLRRIISDDRIAEGGQDVSPTYLADGRILFSSTRQQANQAILLDEGKPQYQSLEESMGGPAFVLHVMNADGTDIQQISFNQSHDLDPVLLSDGRILFSRWDRAGSDKGMHLYSMQSDGSQLAFMYGIAIPRHHDHNGCIS